MGGLRGWLFNSTTELLAHDIRLDFYKQVLNKDIPFFDKNRSGDLSKHQTRSLYFSQPHHYRCYKHSKWFDPKYIDGYPHGGHNCSRYHHYVLYQLVTHAIGYCWCAYIVIFQFLLYDETARHLKNHFSNKR